MNRRSFVKYIPAVGAVGILPSTLSAKTTPPAPSNPNERSYWANTLYKIASPVLSQMSQGKLRASMPVETPPKAYQGRENVTHLEALGRTLAGVAPWLALPDSADHEGQMRKDLREKALKSIAHSVNPNSPD